MKPQPEPRVGKCLMCSGVITEKFDWEFPSGPMVYGGPPRGWWASSGLSCQDCGIMYAKIPKVK